MANEEVIQRKVFTFEWRIEKFMFWQETKPGYFLVSPRFYALPLDAGMWYLTVCPNGRNGREKCICLTLQSLKCIGNGVHVDIEWSCLDSDGSPLNTEVLTNQRIVAGGSLELPRGPDSDRVFVTQRAIFLTQGNLTLRCRIWGSLNNLIENEFVFGRTSIDVRQDSFLWPILRFSHLSLTTTIENLAGVNFAPLLECPVETNLTLTGTSLEDSTVRLEVIFRNLTCPLWVKLKFFVLDSNREVMKSFDKDRIFMILNFEYRWTIPNFVKRRELLAKCLRDDVLTVGIKISIIPQYTSIVERTYRGEVNPVREIPICLPIAGGIAQSGNHLDIAPKPCNSMAVLLEDLHRVFENKPLSGLASYSRSFGNRDILQRFGSLVALKEDFLKAYRDKTMCDIELRSSGVLFFAHKVVLSARSPVFNSMLSGDLEKTNPMYIKDLDVQTLEKFLFFLYSATVTDLDCRSAAKLCYAADAYRVPSLKLECLSVLRSEIKVSNVFDVLELAGKLENAELTSLVHNFIMEHCDDVIKSVEWEKFLAKNPLSAAKIMTEIFKKRISKN